MHPSPPSDRPAALIVGAGIFGVCTALALVRRGWAVTLLEQATPGHSRASSGGESRLLRSSHGADRWYTDMAWAARQAWRRLEEETGADLLAETGLVWFARTDHGWEADSLRVCAEAGVPVERLTPDEVAGRYPSVRTDDVAFGVWEPAAGVLRARRAVVALADLAVRNGVQLRAGVRAVPEAGGVRAGDDVLHADRVVWACGPWLPRLFGDRVEMAVTQQDTCFFVAPPEWDAARVPAWVDFAGAAYGCGALDGHGFKCSSDMAGPPLDPDRDDRLPAAGNLDAARRILAHRFPALAGAPLSGTRTCQYTTTPDTQFVISPLDDDAGVWLLGGGSGHGFKHGPALGEFVADVLAGDVAPPARFGLAPRNPATSLRTAGHGR